MPDKHLLCVTGLPRSGSTLLCQLLAEHPEIDCHGMSSPLFGALQALRSHLSDSEFLLAQLDGEFDKTYARLKRSCQAFAAAWWAETHCPVVVDKHRGWLNQIELAMELDPDVRMLVCVRELGQIFGSIEAQHRKTIWLDFPDDLANLSPYARAEALFAPKGVVGGPLRSIQSVQDRSPDEQSRLFFVVFEHLMSEPVAVMKDLYQWLGLEPHSLDPQNLTVRPHEADSYYRFKYRHVTHPHISPPPRHSVSPRIETELKDSYRWFYELFYPGLLDSSSTT
ncbi:MAG: sulfotransferase [Geitlerinemataceae cyanobacterium]